MNIVKFKDSKITSNGNRPESEIENYNKYFRGKYCYAIHADHIVAMKPSSDSDIPGITYDEYVTYERQHEHTDIVLGLYRDGIARLNYSDWEQYIDKSASPMYQNVEHYMEDNDEFDNASDINKLKGLRTQIAQEIVYGVVNGNLPELSVATCPKKWTMLEYYASNMNNDILENLAIFQKMYNNVSSSYIQQTTTGCGCNGTLTTTVINTYNSTSQIAATGCGCGCSSLNGLTSFESLMNGLSSCNIVNEYRKMLKLYMIENFSDIEFWKYIAINDSYVINKIIGLLEKFAVSGLSIFSNTTSNKFDLNYSCTRASSDSRYATFIDDINNIVTALKYIKDGDYSRSSFIKSNLISFANYYEYLQWNGYVVYSDATDYENYE